MRERKTWKKALAQVEAGEMPPKDDAKPLETAEKAKLAAWLKSASGFLDCADPAERDPGPALLRRLTRAEYALSMRDVLGIDNHDFAEGLPAEAPGEGGFDTLAAALNLTPAHLEKYFGAADRSLDRLYARPNERPYRELFAPKDPAAVLARFARLAYRRAPTAEEVERLVKMKADGSLEASLRPALKAVLVSPHFLMRVEEDRPDGRLSDAELAVRLSYFLWSRPPDEALRAATLSDPAVREAQVRRLLADPKARALTEHFASRWVQLEKLQGARPSTEFFPAFNDRLKRAMREETFTFLDKLREEDRSVLELLDADYTWANEELAKFYGLEGVKGPRSVRVALKPEHRRGGLLAMGSVLAMTSHTHRTSPTLRGKYVLEVLLGDPPPPPPPDAGLIKEDRRRGKEPASFRELLAKHAADPSCATCHRRIDPLGFAMDAYDGSGAWRPEQGGKPVETKGTLPDGTVVDGFDGLKKALAGKRDVVVRTLIERLLAYAIGREILPTDECAIREIQAAVEKSGYKYSALVLGVANSVPFTMRRARSE
jgi:hypothetical protein